MFSVDNFYDFMNSHYGLDRDGRNLLYFFRPHGSKQWQDLHYNYADKTDFIDHRAGPRITGAIIFHDQEPFDLDALNTYKWHLIQEKKRLWRINQPLEELILCPMTLRLGWPIMCHSEDDSDDIRFAEKSGLNTCYYFYHGLIARDWFRHWKHHSGIGPQEKWNYRWLLYARDCNGSRQYRARMLKDLGPLRHCINHDWQKICEVPPEASATISVDDSNTSALHIVAETVFDRDKIHLTEKIFKPMVMMQPFVVFAGAGSLQYLRRYGFQTFDSIWDESYDLERDHDRRYQKILKLINDLSNLSDAEINAILIKCRPILEHNHKRFYSESFEQQMLDELHRNMSRSLERQQTQTKHYPGGVMVHQFELLRRRGESIPPWLIEDFHDLMQALRRRDPDRHQDILHQYPWLLHDLV